MRNRYLIFAAVCSCIVSLVAQDLQADTIFQSVGIASSPNPVGSGARALGMGGAFIAVADDATAASWNPGGLVQLERPEASIVGDFSYREEALSSASQPEVGNRSTLDTTRLNYLSFSFPFFVLDRNMVVSANYQRLYDFDRYFGYSENLSGSVIGTEVNRYVQDGYLGAIGLAYAAEITPAFSLGVTTNLWTDALGIRNGWQETLTSSSTITALNLPPIIPLVPPQQRVTTTQDDYRNFEGINWNFGLLWSINRYVTLGAVLKTPFAGDVDHRFSQTVVDGSGNLVSATRLVESGKLHLPLSYGAGIACRFSDRWSLGLDLYLTDWSDYYIQDGEGNRFSPIDGRPLELSDVGDTTQVRFGTEYLFLFPEKFIVIPVRFGAFYDPEPQQGGSKDFYGISVGSGIGYKNIVFDAAYVFRWADHVNGDNLITTGDTRLDARQHSVLASVIFYF